MLHKIFICLGCCLVFLLQNTEGVAVMSVDLGSEWMKIAIVSPGVPMEIALNKESKRKTPVTIAFREGERTFGEDAANVAVRFPKNSYSYLLELLGKSVDNPIVKLFEKRFPYYDIVADPDRGTVLFQHDAENQYSPEELLAMLLQKAQEFAQTSAGQPIKEAVLTVPGYFNQVERKALLKAAELAGIKVLQLMNDYTAVALNYGIFRRKDFNETAQYILFYDMGASSTSATVVSYQLVKTKEKGFSETNPQLAILGVGYDRTLGGLEVQVRLRDFLAKKFNEMKKTPNDVFKNPRAMSKLFKEAGRVKNVLSANTEHNAQVEGLLDDVDFRLMVNREDLESLCSDLFDRVKGPIEQALKSSGLDLSVINQIILVGAGTRMPKIQEKLYEVVKMDLGKSINADEAAALGAVYKAADLSSGFKVKKFITKDAVIFPITVMFEREADGQVKQVKRTLFGPMNPYPQKKVLTFNKHQSDFNFYVNYADLEHLPLKEVEAIGSLNLSRVELSNVGQAISKTQGKNMESKGIKAHFTLDESGLLTLSNVELVVEKTLTEEELAAEEESPLSKLGSTISKLFTGHDSTDEKSGEKDEKLPEDGKPEEENKDNEGQAPTAGDGTHKEQQEGEDLNKSDDKGEKAGDAKNATKSSEKKPKVVVIKEPIGVKEEKMGIHELLGDQLQQAIKKIEKLDEFDRQKHRREGALNALESYAIDAQNKLFTDEYQAAAKSEELENIQQSCSQILDWLYEDGSDPEVTAEIYEEKLTELKSLTRPLFRRVKEHQERPEALETLTSVLNGSKIFLANARNTSNQAIEGLFTDVELETLEKAITDVKEWKTKMETDQAALALSDTPVLTVRAIMEKINQLDREVKYLVNKAKIWKPKQGKDETKEKESVKNGTQEEEDEVEVQPDDDDIQEEPAPVVEDTTESQGSDVPKPVKPKLGSSLPKTEGKEEEKSHTEL